MIKKQTLTILICGGLFLALLVAWLVLPGLLAVETPEEEPPILLDGEVLGPDNSIYMFPYVQRADIDSIEVHNEHGTFTFYRDEDDAFYIKGKELTPFSTDLFSSLVVNAGMTRSLRRIEGEVDLHEYGLAPEDEPAYYILTTVSGQTHTVYIGDAIPTEGGYYCRYEGRDAVYILDSSIGTTFLCDDSYYMSPLLGYPLTTSDANAVDDFKIVKNGELLIHLNLLTPAENGSDKTDEPKYSREFIVPQSYDPDLQAYSQLLDGLIALVGSEVVAAGEELTDDPTAFLRENYGISFAKDDIADAYFILSYRVNEEESFIYFSEPDEEGYVYAFSSLYWHVVKLHKDAAFFLDWELIDYIDPPLFTDYIYNVETIEIEGTLGTDGEELTVDAVFHLDGDPVNEVLNSVRFGDSESYDADTLKNFRQLYNVILLLRLQDYADHTDLSRMTYMATLRITRIGGEPIEYVFYAYNTRRCYYTVDGVGEFYVSRDHVEKMLRDTDRLLNGLPVDANGRD